MEEQGGGALLEKNIHWWIQGALLGEKSGGALLEKSINWWIEGTLLGEKGGGALLERIDGILEMLKLVEYLCVCFQCFCDQMQGVNSFC